MELLRERCCCSPVEVGLGVGEGMERSAARQCSPGRPIAGGGERCGYLVRDASGLSGVVQEQERQAAFSSIKLLR